VPLGTCIKKYTTRSFASGKAGVPGLLPNDEISRLPCDSSRHLDTPLLTETVLVAISAILMVGLSRLDYFSTINWLSSPAVLVTAALIPTAIKRRRLAQIGFNINHIGASLRLLLVVCLAVFPTTFLFLWVLNLLGLELPLQAVLPPKQGWFSWLLYQFLYVAVAEEIFFRGYIQSNVLRLTDTIKYSQAAAPQWTSIVVSAGFFAVAHILIYGHIIAALTFLPGLVLGWLFARTRSLLAPILFHGLANACYCLILSILA
jgi:membrane protease YdiL (CAAX protease family)